MFGVEILHPSLQQRSHKTNIFTMASTWHPILKSNHPSPAKMSLSLPVPGPLQGSILSYPQSNAAGLVTSTSGVHPHAAHPPVPAVSQGAPSPPRGHSPGRGWPLSDGIAISRPDD